VEEIKPNDKQAKQSGSLVTNFVWLNSINICRCNSFVVFWFLFMFIYLVVGCMFGVLLVGLSIQLNG
jgi:hypothetical protein